MGAGTEGEEGSVIELAGFDLLTLSGDEDGGVGIGCRDHYDGGRPLGYLGWTKAYDGDPQVTQVDSVARLIEVGRRHLDDRHGHAS